MVDWRSWRKSEQNIPGDESPCEHDRFTLQNEPSNVDQEPGNRGLRISGFLFAILLYVIGVVASSAVGILVYWLATGESLSFGWILGWLVVSLFFCFFHVNQTVVESFVALFIITSLTLMAVLVYPKVLQSVREQQGMENAREEIHIVEGSAREAKGSVPGLGFAFLATCYASFGWARILRNRSD